MPNNGFMVAVLKNENWLVKKDPTTFGLWTSEKIRGIYLGVKKECAGTTVTMLKVAPCPSFVIWN